MGFSTSTRLNRSIGDKEPVHHWHQWTTESGWFRCRWCDQLWSPTVQRTPCDRQEHSS